MEPEDAYNPQELEDAYARVHDRTTFIEFVEALVADREDEVAKERIAPSSPYGPGANGWENGTIEDYLERSVQCAVDNDFRHLPEEPSWKAFATFLYYGKSYE